MDRSVTEISRLSVAHRFAVQPMFGGDSNEGDEVRRFHPEGMPAISRGLSVRDTPGATAQKGDWHPEGMQASSECLPISRGEWSNNFVLRGSSLARRASEGFTFDNGLPSLARRASC